MIEIDSSILLGEVEAVQNDDDSISIQVVDGRPQDSLVITLIGDETDNLADLGWIAVAAHGHPAFHLRPSVGIAFIVEAVHHRRDEIDVVARNVPPRRNGGRVAVPDHLTGDELAEHLPGGLSRRDTDRGVDHAADERGHANMADASGVVLGISQRI